MRYFTTSLIVLSLIIVSCGDNSQGNSTSENSSDLNVRIQQLEEESAQKDSMINESLAFFTEIQNNLEAIEVKKDEIRIRSTNREFTADDKTWIIEQIKHINHLREENLKTIKQLNTKLKNNNIKIKQLEKMVDDLLQSIRDKDQEISILQDDLVSLDKAYARLFDAYQEKAQQVEELTEQLNTVYYTYGTEDELIKNKVIERKNGFIGIGKSIRLVDSFNERYFVKFDMIEEDVIEVEGTELKFITDHPSKSYALKNVGKNTEIRIKNPREFWKVSNYLVIVVE
jgi:predicted RNase H-like nuclease (RuvC/YqgF family)